MRAITKYKDLKTLTLDEVCCERGDAVDIKDNKIKNYILTIKLKIIF